MYIPCVICVIASSSNTSVRCTYFVSFVSLRHQAILQLDVRTSCHLCHCIIRQHFSWMYVPRVICVIASSSNTSVGCMYLVSFVSLHHQAILQLDVRTSCHLCHCVIKQHFSWMYVSPVICVIASSGNTSVVCTYLVSFVSLHH